MLNYLTDIWENLLSVIKSITVVDIFDMLFLSIIVFVLLKLIKETRAEQLIKGIAVMFVVLLLLNQFQFKAMGVISEMFYNVGILAIIVMFQPELRRALEKVGRTKMVSSIGKSFDVGVHYDPTKGVGKALFEVANACENLSATKTGALIVLERQTKLGEQIDNGTVLNAVPSSKLLLNIFVPNTPLHDGAVIIRDGIIVAAACFLPTPLKQETVEKELGSRHRAAIGISEVSDAVVVVVSEETGIISVAEDGEISRGFSRDSLLELLKTKFFPDKPEEKRKHHSSKKKRKGGK